MFKGHLDPDVVLAGHRQDGIDPFGLLAVVNAALGVLDVEERIAQPDPYEVAAVGG
jgi:hypothetical protein